MTFSEWTKKNKGRTGNSVQPQASQSGTQATPPSVDKMGGGSPSFSEWTRQHKGQEPMVRTVTSGTRTPQEDLQPWLNDLDAFSKRISGDKERMDKTYQAAGTYEAYQKARDAEIEELLGRAYSIQDHFAVNKELYDGAYGAGTTSQFLRAVKQNISYLKNVRAGLQNDREFWGQFADEQEFKTYKQMKDYTELGAADRELGQFGAGNIDLYNRPQLQNADGSISTVRSITINEDGKEIVIPTVRMGHGFAPYQMTDQQAIDWYHYTGEYLGKFDTQEEAEAYAKKLHQAQEFYYGSRPDKELTTKGEADLDEWATFWTSLLDEQAPPVYKDSGWKDPFYAWVNGSADAGAYLKLQDNTYGAEAGALGHVIDDVVGGNQEAAQMTPEEVATYNYIHKNRSPGEARAFYEFIKSDLYRRQRAAEEKKWAEWAAEDPVGSSAFSILVSPMKGVSYAMQLGEYLGSGKIDQNAPYNSFSYVPAAIRGQVVQDIEKYWVDRGHEFGGKTASFIYQTGMSMGDFLFTTAVSGGNETVALAIMGTGAAADATIEAKDRGLSDDQAFALGTIAGIAEVVTEKFSLDALLKGKWEQGAVRYIIKNAFTEGTEEVGSDAINLFADILIAKDQSQWAQAIAAYEADGMSESEAFWRAVQDQALSMGLDFLGGALSGGVLSGGNVAVSSAINYYQTGKVGKEFQSMGPEVVQAIIETGLESDPSTKSFQIAQQLQAKVEAGETITAQDLGKLYRENVLTIEQEEQAEATRQEAETNIETAEHPTGETVNTDRPVDLVRPEPAGVVEGGRQVAQNVPVAVENRGVQAPAETEGVEWAGTEEARRDAEAQVQEETERRDAPQTTERTVLEDGRQQATQEGDHLHDGDAGRLYGPGAGEQGGRLAGGAVQTGGSAEQGRVAVERQNYAKSLRRQRVSSAEGLGLAMGTDTPSVTVLEEGDWDAGMRATAERVQQETGRSVTYVLGSIPIRTSSGGAARVRGVYTQDGRIILQADHMRLTTDQIADHEIFHDKAFQTPGLVREIEARITERFSQEEFEKIVTTYIEKLRGVIDLPADADGAAIDAAYVAIMEEIFADAYAGINAFGAHAEQYNETVEGIMAERGVARRSQETAAATDRRTGPPAESTGEQYSVNESFGQELEEWDDAGRPEGERFILGSTGDVLQGLGAVEADIFMEGDKISTILENHPEMTLEEIERVPEILDDPVLVMKSQGSNRRGQNTRLVVFGSFKATNGQPIMSVLDLRPVEGGFAVADMQKVNSTYTRDNALNYIQGGEILHADKKRTIPLLRTVGLHGPIELQRSGSMGSISYNGQNVNIQGTPFEDVVRQGEQEAEDIDGAESMTERGRKERFSLEEPDADGEGRELDKKRAELEEMEARLKELNGERYKAFLTIQQYETSDAYKDMIDRIDKVDGADLDALVSEMEEREKSLGISEANRRYGELTGEIKNLSAQVEERKKEVRKAALEEARGQYTPAFAKEYADAAEDEFGTTDDFSLAGYLDTNGELLDFSEGQGQRVQDHREIADVLDFLPDGYEYSDPLIEFMNLGNIRIMSAGVEIAVEPNERQREQLLRFFEERNGEVTVDFSDQDGRNTGTLEYDRYTDPEDILEDIDEYFRTGEIPRESELSKFWEKFSVEDESEDEGKKKERTKPKAVAPSKPIIAKNDLRRTLLSTFSVPEGAKAEVGAIIDGYADRLLREGSLTEEDRKAFFDRMYSEGVMTVEADEYYQDGRRAVVGGRVYVTESEKAEFGDDWNDFRKRAFAAGVYLTNDRSDNHVDVWNMELADTLPGVFDREETDSKSILERVVQLAEEGKDEKVSLAEYTARLARQEFIPESEFLDNMERQMDWALRTFAEKANLEIKLRERAGVKMAQERAERVEMATRQRERQQLRDLQQRTLKQLQWLSKNRFRAPEELRAAWDEVLGDIDIYAVGAANELNWSKKYGATWKDLGDMYKAAKASDPNFLPSKELERIVARLDGDKIADMDIGALQDLYKAAIGLRTEFYNRNNVINDETRRLFAEVYTEAKQEIETAEGGFTGKKLDTFLNMEHLTPMNFLERMAGWRKDGTWMSMARQLEQGERAVRDYTVRSHRVLEDFLTERADWVKTADGQGKDAIWYEVEVPELLELGKGDKPLFGKTVKVYMTPAQKVQLYLESKNTDNLRHMTGGRTFVDKELYSKGQRQEALAQGTTIRLAPETVKALVSDLTEEEMELARLLEGYYNQFAKGEINRVSNILYGYDKAQSKNYAPIFTNQNYTTTTIGVFDTTAEGVGHMKSRQYAVNPSYNISAFDAFERHSDQTARFVGMAIPARNWQTLLNWREKNNSTGDVITHKWGEEGKKYIDNLLNELQGGRVKKRDTAERILDTALSRYISSVFGFNPSIVLKQAMSFPLAGTYLGWENIPNIAKALKTPDALINTYTSELAYRLMGYATPETAQLKNNPSKLSENRVLKFTFGGGAITAMDGWTVKSIWGWAENMVSREHPELELGTQEQIDAGESPYYKEVAKAFEEAVSRSQPMYDVMHRAGIMRSDSKITRTLTLFKTVPIQQYNMLRQMVAEAQQAKRDFAAGKVSEGVFRQARGKAGRAVVGVILAGLGIEAINFLNALLKNKAKRYRDDDDELTWKSAGAQATMNFIQSNAGMIAGGDILAEYIGSLVTGDKWYGVETPGVTQIVDLFEDGKDAFDAIGKFVKDGYDVVSKGGDLGEYLRRHGSDYLGELEKVCETAATYIGGVPANNIRAYALGALSWVSPEFATAYEDATATANKGKLSGLKGGALETRVGDILINRLGEAEDETVETLAALYESGYTGAIPTDTPSSVSINGEDVKLGAYQQQFFDRVWRENVAGTLDDLVGSAAFRRADEETRAKMVKKLYDYAAQRAKTELFENYAADKWVAEATASGNVAEWIGWKVLSGDNSANFSKFKEAGLGNEAALALAEDIGGLSPEAGKKQVSNLQKFRAIIDGTRGQDEQMAALSSVMGASEYARLQVGVRYGITPALYVEAREAINDTSPNQDEAKRAIKAMPGLTKAEAAVLWQIQNKSWKPESNPFSKKTGRKVYNDLNAEEEKEPEGLSLPSVEDTDTDQADVPGLSLPSID